jgi:type IV fimbrial biogenesis protein FimT
MGDMNVTDVSNSHARCRQPAWCKVGCVSSPPMNPSTRQQCARGFSLLELVIVMGIAGILLTIAIPSYRYVTSSNRVSAEINGLLGDLQFARAEAIKEGLPVTVCISADGASCANVAGTPAWNTGWIIFSDTNGNERVDAGEGPPLRIQNAFTGADTFTANNQISAITFNREGFATANASLANNDTLLTLHTSPVSNASTRCLSVLSAGAMAVQAYGGTCL